MTDYRIVKQVHRKVRNSSKVLKTIMLIFIVIFMLSAIMFSRGFMLPCFLMTALYVFYDTVACKEYEYVLDDRELSIYMILGRRYRLTRHKLDLDQMIVLAPHDSNEVSAWKKGGIEKIKKFDYTSYEDNTPYYTMIINENNEKIKLLLDLDDEILENIKRKYPNIVFR